MIKLSPSSLNLFLACPRCFWLYVNKNAKRPGPPVATITTGLDKIVKIYFDQYRAQGLLPPFLEGRLPGKLITDFPKKGWLEFNDASHAAKLGGYLDECIQLKENLYAALDHKTRGSAPQEVHKAYQFQMDAYTFLLEENHFPTQKTAYLVYYIPQKILPDSNFQFEVLVKKIDTDPQRAKTVFYQALDNLRAPISPPNESCEFCRWTATVDIK